MSIQSDVTKILLFAFVVFLVHHHREAKSRFNTFETVENQIILKKKVLNFRGPRKTAQRR
jgi:hypothetical protein